MNITNILNEQIKYIIMIFNSNKQHKDINDLNGLLINLSGKYYRDELSDGVCIEEINITQHLFGNMLNN